jgi:biopolymer transport protein ExbD
MKLSQQRIVEPIGFNMTPMIDVVFLLIIFFMTVSQLNRNVLPSLKLPVSTVSDDAQASATFVLNIDSQGQFQVNDEVVLRDRLDALLQQSIAVTQTANQPPHARLRCAADCSTTDVNFVFDRLSKMGFQSVTVAVRKP